MQVLTQSPAMGSLLLFLLLQYPPWFSTEQTSFCHLQVDIWPINSFVNSTVFMEHGLNHSISFPNINHTYFQCGDHLNSKEAFMCSVFSSLRVSVVQGQDLWVTYKSGRCQCLPCVNKRIEAGSPLWDVWLPTVPLRHSRARRLLTQPARS